MANDPVIDKLKEIAQNQSNPQPEPTEPEKKLNAPIIKNRPKIRKLD